MADSEHRRIARLNAMSATEDQIKRIDPATFGVPLTIRSNNRTRFICLNSANRSDSRGKETKDKRQRQTAFLESVFGKPEGGSPISSASRNQHHDAEYNQTPHGYTTSSRAASTISRSGSTGTNYQHAVNNRSTHGFSQRGVRPEVTKEELLREIKSHRPGAPVQFLSAGAQNLIITENEKLDKPLLNWNQRPRSSQSAHRSGSPSNQAVRPATTSRPQSRAEQLDKGFMTTNERQLGDLMVGLKNRSKLSKNARRGGSPSNQPVRSATTEPQQLRRPSELSQQVAGSGDSSGSGSERGSGSGKKGKGVSKPGDKPRRKQKI